MWLYVKCGFNYTKTNQRHPQYCWKQKAYEAQAERNLSSNFKIFSLPACHWHSYHIQRDTFLIQWAFSPSLSIKLSLTLSTGMILLRFSHNSSPVCNAELSVMKSNLRIVGGFGLVCVINLYQFWRWYWSGKKNPLRGDFCWGMFHKNYLFCLSNLSPSSPPRRLDERKSWRKISDEDFNWVSS